jgi:protease YdgD
VRCRAVAIAIIVAGAGCAAAQPELGESWPWSAVGRVLRDGGGPCSGALINPRTVLTVGHCVASGRPWIAIPPERLTVVLGGVEHMVNSVRIADVAPFTAEGDIGDLRHDWAWLELARDAAVEALPYGGMSAARRALALDEPIFKVGWLAGRLRRDVACKIVAIEPAGEVVIFGCPGGTGEGRSGSALVLRNHMGYEVIGVQSAEGENAFAKIGVAIAPTP